MYCFAKQFLFIYSLQKVNFSEEVELPGAFGKMVTWEIEPISSTALGEIDERIST